MASSKPPSSATKSRRIRMPGTRTGSDDMNTGSGSLSLSFSRQDPVEAPENVSVLPHEFRVRLHSLFHQIEREFEALYAENLQCEINRT